MSDQNQQQQENLSKEQKKFERNFKKLVALFSGEALFSRIKLEKEELSTVITELAKEEKENLFKKFKDGAKALIKSKQEFDRFVQEQEKQMQKAVSEKQKEFNKQMEDLFSLVSHIESIERDYYTTLTQLSSSPVNEPTAPQNTEQEPETPQG